MGFRQTITASALISCFHAGVCAGRAGSSALVPSPATPLSSAATSSPNWGEQIFAQLNAWCPVGHPDDIYPASNTCCKAEENSQSDERETPSTSRPSSGSGPKIQSTIACERFTQDIGYDTSYSWVNVEGEEGCVPILTFDCGYEELNEGWHDQLCASMCEGIRDQKKTNPERVIDDRTILLHKRKGKNEAMGCGGLCEGLVSWTLSYDLDFDWMECDEFPPASTMEGGGPTLTCILKPHRLMGQWFLEWFYSKMEPYFYPDPNADEQKPFIISMRTCELPEIRAYPGSEILPLLHANTTRSWP